MAWYEALKIPAAQIVARPVAESLVASNGRTLEDLVALG